MENNGLIALLRAAHLSPAVVQHGDDWAEETIEDLPYSPYPGRLSLAFTPWLREPIRAATSESGVSLVVMVMAVQGGKTLCYDIATAYHSAHNRSSILVISDNDDNAKDYAKTRLNLLFSANSTLRPLLSTSHRKSTDLMHELTNGTQWWTVGAANKKNLQRRSIQIVIGDEVWLWPEGHMTEAVARTTRFTGSSKCIFGSQAGVVGTEFVQFWDRTDKREWMWQCPWCGEIQPWEWSMVDWDHTAHTPDGKPDYNAIRNGAFYKCQKCPATWPDNDRSRATLNAVSFWQATEAGASAANRGYHMSAIPYMSAGELACEFVESKIKLKQGNPEPYKIFVQKRLANFWDPLMGVSEDDVVEEADVAMFGTKAWEQMSWIRIDRDRRRSFVDAPAKDGADYKPCAFMTVDVQKDCVWYVVRAWNKNGDSMLIDCGVRGSRYDIPQLQTAYKIPKSHVGVDSGYDTLNVYKFCYKFGFFALKGDATRAFTHKTRRGYIERPYSEIKRGFIGGGASARLLSFSSDTFKSVVRNGITRTNKGGTPRWMVPTGVPENYKKHLYAENPFTDRLGNIYWRNNTNDPNHCLDCEAMNACLAMREGIPITDG